MPDQARAKPIAIRIFVGLRPGTVVAPVSLRRTVVERRTAMIRQRLRLLLLVGLLISAVTANGTIAAPDGTAARHHQPTPCEPDC